MRKWIAFLYSVSLVGVSTQALASAQQIILPPPVLTVSGIAPDVTGNVPFGCPLSPFNVGTNMAVTQMDNACALHYAGPLETTAQLASGDVSF